MACGEYTHTGLHGGNRLASNSLLEAVVFAHRSYLKVVETDRNQVTHLPSLKGIKYASANADIEERITHWRQQLRDCMDQNAGINRMDQTLRKAVQQIQSLETKVEKTMSDKRISLPLIELRNLISVAKMIVDASLKRKTNKGTFFKIEVEPVIMD